MMLKPLRITLHPYSQLLFKKLMIIFKMVDKLLKLNLNHKILAKEYKNLDLVKERENLKKNNSIMMPT